MGARRVPGSAQQDFSEKVRVKARPQGRAHVKEHVEAEGRMFCAKTMRRPRGKKIRSCARADRSS